MKQADWYFDYVSPFAYLHARQLSALDGLVELTPRPILLVALLKHWGQRGPAEIPGKRLYTYRYLNWLAQDLGVPFRMPASHPFNPLPYLRLTLALGLDRAGVLRLFEALYTSGADPAAPERLQAVCRLLGAEDPEALAADPAAKDALRRNTEAAIAAGVFGVPSVVVDGQVFWGVESLPMLRAYLQDPALFDQPEMRRAARIPSSASRL